MTSTPFGLFRRWLPIAAVATVLCMLTYATVQQSYRSGANDPQIQMAEDASRLLAGGATAESIVPAARDDLGDGLAPFLVVYDSQRRPIAGSATLHGAQLTPPAGVFDFVSVHGEERVTLQPEHGVRLAAVIRRTSGPTAGFVLAARSLREVENRELSLRTMCAVALLVALGGSLMLAWLLQLGGGREH